MRIKTVTVRCNIELKPYQHVHVEMTAELAPSDSVGGVIDELKKRIAVELMISKFGSSDASPMTDVLQQASAEVEAAKKQVPSIRRRKL